MNRRTREIIAKIEEAKSDSIGPAREVVEHLYWGILAMPEFVLKDGTKARLDPYIAPEVGDDGRIQCGFDVLLDNGSHLEFMVTNTGFGKSFAKSLGERPKADGRGRR